MALWQSLDRFDARCSLRTWTYRVAHNLAISRVIRRRTRMPTLVSVDERAGLAGASGLFKATARAGLPDPFRRPGVKRQGAALA